MNLSLETVLRCLDLLPIVRENQGIELAELSRRSGIAEKTIADQLIPTLMLCGSPPYMPHDYVSIWLEGDRVFVEFADHFKRPVTLLPIEITALHLALSSSGFLGGHDAEVERRLSELKEKIERALPREQRIFLEQSDRISIDDHPDKASPHLAELKRAVAERRKAEIDYLSWGESRMARRVTHPHGIVIQDGVTYILSHDERRGHIVAFRLDRIGAVALTDERFDPDPEFSLDRYAREGIFCRRDTDEIELIVRVEGHTARLTSETLDQRQWSWEKDGSLLVRLPTSRPRAAVRWALSLGPDAEVIGPPELRAMARDEIAGIRANYAG